MTTIAAKASSSLFGWKRIAAFRHHYYYYGRPPYGGGGRCCPRRERRREGNITTTTADTIYDSTIIRPFERRSINNEWWNASFIPLHYYRHFSTDSNHKNNNNKRPLELYNSLTERIEPLRLTTTSTTTTTEQSTSSSSSSLLLLSTKDLAWYTCGPTTYAPAHLGHARTYVCLDILRRVLTALHPESTPLFVLNITDIDDKIILAASAAAAQQQQAAAAAQQEEEQQEHGQEEEGEEDNAKTSTTTTTTTALPPPPIQLARRFEQDFWRDWDALHCLRPHVVTRVTEHVESHIVPFIQTLVDKQMAYVLITKDDDDDDDGGGGGVYFDVRSYNEQMGTMTKYGKLAPPAAAQDIPMPFLDSTTSQQQQQPLSSHPHKKDPRDFVLWKKQKPGETVFWSSPWGNGRPGWHIECSAMIQAVQEQFPQHQFMVHAGGIDLRFPHHTNEIAQSEAYLGTGQWIPHWVHTGHLHIDGLKMSKSLKNFVTIQEFLSSRPSERNDHNNDDNDNNDHDDDDLDLSSMWHCPADDFRLWCLGLSGSYRGPATFSESRMAEAKTVRQKMVRFLVDGEAWVNRRNKNNVSTSSPSSSASKLWTKDDYALFDRLQQAKRKALAALQSDLDGSTFVSELVAVAELGSAYLQHHHDSGTIEVVKAVLEEVRALLRMVGFTAKTVDAGLFQEQQRSHGDVFADQAKIMDVLVNFRSAVRQVALQHKEEDDNNNNNNNNTDAATGMKTLLRLSDEIRDASLPKIGIQMLDGTGDGDRKDTWKRCPPRELPSNRNETEKPSPFDDDIDIHSIPLTELFKSGPYENAFSQFTEDGVPTHNADGTEVSKRLLKKLLKKRDAHRTRLEKNVQKS
jgi:cysteinyl-tRNA synthetase